MGRKKNEDCRKHVTEVENGLKWICNYCKDKFSGGASRIEAHLRLNGIGGGIRRCSKYPPVVGNEGVHNTMASTSSNQLLEDVINRIYSTPDQVTEGVPEMIGTHTRRSVNHPNNVEIMNLSEGKISINGRRKHEHCWKHVTEVEKGRKWICNYCNRPFSGGASRIEAHLGLNGKGGGIRRCSNYHEGVHNNMASTSSNPPPEAVINRVYSTQDQAWRSRKQKQVESLQDEANKLQIEILQKKKKKKKLQIENQQLLENIAVKEEGIRAIIAANGHLRAELLELMRQLESLNSILEPVCSGFF